MGIYKLYVHTQLVFHSEELYEDTSFPDRQLCALVASKVWHVTISWLSCDPHMTVAAVGVLPLGIISGFTHVRTQCRGQVWCEHHIRVHRDHPVLVLCHYLWPLHFDLLNFSTAKCIDHYTALRVKKFEKGLDEGEVIDPRLEAVVERMFERCLEQSHFKQAAGIAFETRRIDVLEQAIRESIEFNKRSKVSESVHMHIACCGVPLTNLHVYLCLLSAIVLVY